MSGRLLETREEEARVFAGAGGRPEGKRSRLSAAETQLQGRREFAAENDDRAGGGDLIRGSMEREFRKWFRELVSSTKDRRLYVSLMEGIGCILVHEALRFSGGNRSKAARLLGLSRPTLHAKIDKCRLKIETYVEKEPS